jgi:hypothetical protein
MSPQMTSHKSRKGKSPSFTISGNYRILGKNPSLVCISKQPVRGNHRSETAPNHSRTSRQPNAKLITPLHTAPGKEKFSLLSAAVPWLPMLFLSRTFVSPGDFLQFVHLSIWCRVLNPTRNDITHPVTRPTINPQTCLCNLPGGMLATIGPCSSHHDGA